MQTTHGTHVPEEDVSRENGLQGGVRVGAGIVHMFLSGHLTPHFGQVTATGRWGSCVLYPGRPLQEGLSPSPVPSWSLTGAAEQCPGMEGLIPGTLELGPGHSGRGLRAGAGFAGRFVPRCCLRLPFPHQPSLAHCQTFQSLPWQVGAPWSSRHEADRAHLDTCPLGDQKSAPLSGLWKGSRGRAPLSYLLF